MAGVPGAWIECQHTGGDYVFTIHVPDGAGIEAPKPAVKTAEEIIAGLGERQRFDAEAATLDDGTAANDRPAYNATTLNQLRRIRDRVREMGNTARSREWAHDEMLALIDAGPESIREKPWRLPTLEETLDDPEAARVWNAVNKPPLEWHRTADDLPPITGEGDSRVYSEHRPVWCMFDAYGTPVALKAFELHKRFELGKAPEFWCEVEPAPPFVEPPAATREPLAKANKRMLAAVAQTNAERAARDPAAH